MPKNNPGYQVLSLGDFLEFMLNERVSRYINNVVIEHTAPLSYDKYDAKKPLSSIFDLDIYHRYYGYTSLCHHVVILPDGKVGICRPFNDIPGGLPKDMGADISIGVFGNFDSDKMSGLQEQAVLDVAAIICRKFNIEPVPESVTFAHWYDPVTGDINHDYEKSVRKSSPGSRFFRGNKLEEALDEFFLLLKVKYKIHKSVSEYAVDKNPIGKVLVTSDKLRVRNNSDVTGETIDFLQRGTILTIFEKNEDWYKIDTVESRWVSSRFVTEIY